MESKEYIKGVLYNMEDLLKQAKNDNCKSVIIDCEDEIMHYNQVLKDLEDYEELKKIMGTPIQDIMKRLKILEIIKPYIEKTSDGIISCHNLMLSPICDRYKKEYDLLKEYLDGKD